MPDCSEPVLDELVFSSQLGAQNVRAFFALKLTGAICGTTGSYAALLGRHATEEALRDNPNNCITDAFYIYIYISGGLAKQGYPSLQDRDIKL